MTPQKQNSQPLPDLELPPDRSPRWFLFLSVAALVIIASALLWRQFDTRQKILIDAIPQRPATAGLAAFPPVFNSRLTETEQRVRASHGRDAAAALAELASLYHANNFSGQAVHIYTALSRIEQANPRWLFLRAALLQDAGQYEEALPLLQSARMLAPDRIPLRLQLAGLFLKINRSAEAAALYRNVILDDPGNIHAILGLARIDIAAQSWETARAQLRFAADLRPDCSEPWKLLAVVHEKLNQRATARADRARATHTHALPAPPDDWIDALMENCYDAGQLRIAANLASASGGTARARALLDRALTLAPNDAAAHRELGKLLSGPNTGMQIEAREHLERATSLAPADADAWAGLIALGNDAGNAPAAFNDAMLALAHCPQSAGVRFEYGRALKGMGDHDAALSQFQEARRLRFEDAASLSLEIARILLRQNRPDEGERELRAALDADPGQPGALAAMTHLAIKKNDASEAAAWLTRATAEPRVPRNEIDRLNTLYRLQFGKPPAAE